MRYSVPALLSDIQSDDQRLIDVASLYRNFPPKPGEPTTLSKAGRPTWSRLKTLSCIFPVLNGAKLIGACLQSLEPQLADGDEVIVVDNGSTDGTPELIEREFPRVKLIRAGHNLGYGGGANRGMEAACGEAVVILNHDMTFLDGCFAALRQRLEEAGPSIIGCKLLYPDGQTIQHAGGIIRPPRGLPDHHGYRQIDHGGWDEVAYPDYVTGALFVIDRAVLAACGNFDAQFYPLYYEETDYCYRARRAGFPVIYEPRAVAIHHETQTYASRSAAYYQTMERGRLRFVLKNYPPEQLLNEFFPAEQAYVQHVEAQFARDVCLPAYDSVLANLPPLPPAHAAAIVQQLRQLCAAARRAAAAIEVTMPDPYPPLNVPPLREHEFQSNVPVVGPLITGVRRALYLLTAKWPLRVALDQQTRINQQLAQRLLDHEARGYCYEIQLREHEIQLREHEIQLREHERQLREFDARLIEFDARLIEFDARLIEFNARLIEFDARLIEQDHDLTHSIRASAELQIQLRAHLRSSGSPLPELEPSGTQAPVSPRS
jgi:GT2 family glycosyltransferase